MNLSYLLWNIIKSSNLQPSLKLWLQAVQISSLNTASLATKYGGTGIFQGLTREVSGSAATWATVTLRGFCMANNTTVADVFETSSEKVGKANNECKQVSTICSLLS